MIKGEQNTSGVNHHPDIQKIKRIIPDELFQPMLIKLETNKNNHNTKQIALIYIKIRSHTDDFHKFNPSKQNTNLNNKAVEDPFTGFISGRSLAEPTFPAFR